jgi:hypothetical protein
MPSSFCSYSSRSKMVSLIGRALLRVRWACRHGTTGSRTLPPGPSREPLDPPAPQQPQGRAGCGRPGLAGPHARARRPGGRRPPRGPVPCAGATVTPGSRTAAPEHGERPPGSRRPSPHGQDGAPPAPGPSSGRTRPRPPGRTRSPVAVARPECSSRVRTVVAPSRRRQKAAKSCRPGHRAGRASIAASSSGGGGPRTSRRRSGGHRRDGPHAVGVPRRRPRTGRRTRTAPPPRAHPDVRPAAPPRAGAAGLRRGQVDLPGTRLPGRDRDVEVADLPGRVHARVGAPGDHQRQSPRERAAPSRSAR